MAIIDYNDRITLLNRIYDDLKRIGLVKNKSQFATKCLQRSPSYCFKWGKNRCPSNLTFMSMLLYLIFVKKEGIFPSNEISLLNSHINSIYKTFISPVMRI